MNRKIEILINILILPIISAGISSILGALILQKITTLIAKFKLKYWTAYKVAFLAFSGSYIVGFTIGIPAISIYSAVIAFLVQAAIYFIMLKHPETGSIRLGTACLISLVYLIVGGLIAFLIGFIATFAELQFR
ncbi:MAG TPA: hypothetical protein ENG83_13140 [Nitrospirae bacterium]|nr:hypothetical protein [Nitrospirota bacterium]HDZ00650.1 hypothetical protein [Nitrospirota bacterium]